VDLFIVQPVKIELINAKKLSYTSFPTFDSSDGNDVPGIRDIVSRMAISCTKDNNELTKKNFEII
jgi:hypothetical protein